MYGLGTGDALANLSDLSGKVGLGTAISANGASGVSWYYEKVGESVLGLDDVSQKLYLVDAHAGGNSSAGSAIDWTILATVDLANTPAGWFRLSISIDAAGNGTAIFDNQVFQFHHSGGNGGRVLCAVSRERATRGQWRTGFPSPRVVRARSRAFHVRTGWAWCIGVPGFSPSQIDPFLEFQSRRRRRLSFFP